MTAMVCKSEWVEQSGGGNASHLAQSSGDELEFNAVLWVQRIVDGQAHGFARLHAQGQWILHGRQVCRRAAQAIRAGARQILGVIGVVGGI